MFRVSTGLEEPELQNKIKYKVWILCGKAETAASKIAVLSCTCSPMLANQHTLRSRDDVYIPDLQRLNVD